MYEHSAGLYDAIYSYKNYKREADQLRKLIRRYKRSTGKSLLDVACGTGGHVAYFQRYYEVEGLDISPRMLRIARGKFPNIKFHIGDMASFRMKRQFDVITCLFSSIAYAKRRTTLRKAVRNLAHHLKPGGVMIIEPWFSPSAFRAGTLHGTFADKPTLKVARMNVSRVEKRVSILDFHYLVGTTRGIRYFRESYGLGLFSRREYEVALRACGLRVTYDREGLTGRGLYIATQPITQR